MFFFFCLVRACFSSHTFSLALVTWNTFELYVVAWLWYNIVMQSNQFWLFDGPCEKCELASRDFYHMCGPQVFQSLSDFADIGLDGIYFMLMSLAWSGNFKTPLMHFLQVNHHKSYCWLRNQMLDTTAGNWKLNTN